jgi:glycosyltransferase involved in cell wall biosynthesis
MRLSVIVAVYNVEGTLRRCVESIVAQKVDSMEVILVNDGSTDRSKDIAEKLQAENPQVKVISQRNGGLSCARNTGLEASTGDYITFVDSDDWLLPDTYPALLRILDSHPDCDILEYLPVIEGNHHEACSFPALKKYSSPRNYWLEGKAYKHTYAWNKVYRRNLLFPNNHSAVRFKPGRLFEDVFFLSELLQRQPKVLITNQKGYVYTYNANGITATASDKELRDLLEGHLHASNLLGMNFLHSCSKTVMAEETEYYLSILNIQIDVCRHSADTPLLPSRKISIRHCPRRMPMIVKALLLNIFGIKNLCQIFGHHK